MFFLMPCRYYQSLIFNFPNLFYSLTHRLSQDCTEKKSKMSYLLRIYDFMCAYGRCSSEINISSVPDDNFYSILKI